MGIINKKNVKYAIKLQIINFIVLSIFLTNFSNNIFTNNLLHFGPNTNFLGLNINSWSKYISIVIFLIFFEIINTFSFKIYTNWYRNNVKNPDNKNLFFTKSNTIKNITLWKIITWTSKMFNLSILFTSKQIQFSFIQFITRTIISNFIDFKCIQNK
tara:strand:- start:385 stop:855 length:471 start_codon:yes stop_codon:yes gene_type:complete